MSAKVYVAMSGGVDSSLSALLLAEQGHQVSGVTLKLWDDQSEAVFTDAKRVADQIGVEHSVIDLREQFKECIISYFADEYAQGRTPNPCVVCNEQIKFGILLQWVLQNEGEFLASGHYARIMFLPEENRYQLFKGCDGKKDQSYALWRLRQDQLSHLLFPLGSYTKEEIRKIAISRNIHVADKPDSQEICFIPDNDYRKYLDQNYSRKQRTGSIVSTQGITLGVHSGIEHFTVGQRKNLGIAAGYPLYVLRIDKENDRIVVGRRDEIYSDRVVINQTNFISGRSPTEAIRVSARIRYNMTEAPAQLKKCEKDNFSLFFDSPQWAVTPGQSAVFYIDQELIGGGIITDQMI